MAQSRRELLDELLDFMGETGDPLARSSAVILLNRVLETIWLKKAWTDHRMPAPFQFTTVPGQRAYVLPDYFGKVAGFEADIRNLSTGGAIAPVSLDDLESAFPLSGTALEPAGVPQYYAIAGTQGVLLQPAAAGEALSVVSSSASDTTVVVVVEGLDVAGNWLRQQVTLTGTAPVLVGTFAQVINFTKGYPDATPIPAEGASSTGVVTLSGATSGPIESLTATESAHERLTLVLCPKPDAPFAIAVPVIRAARKLTSDADEVPRFWGPAIIEEARLEWAYNQGDINLGQLTQSPRPRLTELIQHDNALLYRGMSIKPFV
jgi:hypothetical protein